MSTPIAMTALNGPVKRFREAESVVELREGVSGREGDGPVEDMRFVNPPSRSVAPAEACICEPAISLCKCRRTL